MNKKIISFILLLGLMASSMACGVVAPDTNATSTILVTTQDAATRSARAAQTQHAKYTASVLATIGAIKTADAKATADIKAATQSAEVSATAAAAATLASFVTATADAQATATASSIQQQTATADAIVQSTAQAQPIYSQVQKLKEDGYITNTEGYYIPLPDFDQSWAQLGWYQFYPTQLDPVNFVISARANWTSASRIADLWFSGCGFVFHEDGVQNHYLTYLGLDGRVYLSSYIHGNYGLITSAYYGKVDFPEGEADLTLAVQDNWITFLVNGTKVLRHQDEALKSGFLDLTLVSGTNKDYGIHCTMTNIDLWTLK